MTEEQYSAAEEDLIARLQTMREAQCGARAIPSGSDGRPDDGVDDLDDIFEIPISSERAAAKNEWIHYCRIVKGRRHFPKLLKREGLVSIGDIEFGVVEECGEDLQATHPFKRCNLADFIDKTGYFNLVKFLEFNKKSFPYIYKLGCCLASLRTNEVGCERFFSIAGYVSNPRRSSLKVHHYESIAMLKRNMHQVYIDEDWVVKQYEMKEKDKDWNETDRKSDEMVAALERELYEYDLGAPVASNPGDEEDSADIELAPDPIVLDDSDSDSSHSVSSLLR